MITKFCAHCGKEFTCKTNITKFCSHSCSALHNTEKRLLSFKPAEDNRTKLGKCVKCGEEIQVNIRTDLSKCKCDECKVNSKNRICKVCGDKNKHCRRKDICKKYPVFETLIKYFGFDKTKFGTISVYKEFERIKSKVCEEYFDHQLSTLILAKKYGFKRPSDLLKVLNSLGIQARSLSEANTIACLNNRKELNVAIKYKHGYHTTWNNKQVFYRSSYELDYCKELDDKKIDYEMEKLRILYWDSQLLRQRVAIPDFFLLESNEIIEIKSNYTYDEQNMKDKFEAYREHGYKVKLILEHEEKKLE